MKSSPGPSTTDGPGTRSMKTRKAAWLLAAGLAVVAMIAAGSEGEGPGDDKAAEKTVLARFTAEERKRLGAGETVFRYVEARDEEGKTQGHAWASVVIDAPVDRCFKIFREFDQHHLYIPRKQKSEIIKTWENKTLVHNEFDFYLITIEYTSLFTVDEKNHRVDYDMDPDYKHDINDTEGYFHFERIDGERTLLTYAVTRVDTGLRAPAFVMEYLTSRDLPNVVINVKKRIESGGKWSKED